MAFKQMNQHKVNLLRKKTFLSLLLIISALPTNQTEQVVLIE